MMRSRESWKQIAAFVMAAAVCARGACAAANPYGIAGTGALTKLGMPSGCSEYSWDTLQPSNAINMVRPCKYWVSVGGTHQYWGYHEITDTIDNATQLASWVTSHLGKTLVIGNEPDIGSQDGLTIDQYETLLSSVYWFDQTPLPLFRKATYTYASARVKALACEPSPMHMILYSCSLYSKSSIKVWPFAPPAMKRIEVYYALAGGAKGMSYWWYLPDSVYNGLGCGSAAALALWKEIGLLGAEIKTAQPLLVTSHPVDLPMTVGTNVWARALAAGTNSMVLLVVNDNHTNDAVCCHYTPVTNATVTATLPSWMQFPTAFEIAAGGLGDVSLQTNGNQLQVNLGTLNVTRMIVLSRDAQLRTALQQRYTQQVQPGICSFAPESSR